MHQLQRFLGFAFASADLLVELTPLGHVSAAFGAARSLIGAGEAELAGRSWRDFVSQADHPMIETVLANLRDGERRGPLAVELVASPRPCHISFYRVPGAANIACSLSTAGAPALPRAETDAAGYQTRETFEALAETLLEAAGAIGHELDLALVETPGLAGALDAAGTDAALGIERSLAGALRAEAYGAAPAARVGRERFAVLRPRAVSPDLMRQRLSSVVGLATGDEAIDVTSAVLAADVGA